MSKPLLKRDLFRDLGYADKHDELEELLHLAGLSRPAKRWIAAPKREAVRQLLADHVLAVCNRGDCQRQSDTLHDGRVLVLASSQEHCGICGGSTNATAVDAMVAAMRAAGVGRLCVVGGSPNARTELERLVAKRVGLRLVDGTIARTRKQADADLAWADRLALWGGTMLDHKVSDLYQGRTVIRFARRSIQELAREVARAVRGG